MSEWIISIPHTPFWSYVELDIRDGKTVNTETVSFPVDEITKVEDVLLTRPDDYRMAYMVPLYAPVIANKGDHLEFQKGALTIGF